MIDVVVDIRKGSTTYGETFSIELSQENGKQLWIPEGFGHGFVCLEENSILNYKCTNYYNKESEDAILWNSKDLKIDWGVLIRLYLKKMKLRKILVLLFPHFKIIGKIHLHTRFSTRRDNDLFTSQ